MARLEVDIYKKMGQFTLQVAFTAENEIMALLGASGCGKSMTLKCIAGIEKPDKGRIVLDDAVLFDSEKKIDVIPQKRKVGYMFQDYALFPNMKVVDNIGIVIPVKDKNEKKKRAMEFVERFHLAGLEEHYPSQLSGGQKQRVAMARMLASEPDLILLDEPFSALDAYLRWEMEQEMRNTLQRLEKTTLFVSHDRDEVYRICDSVSCIHEGKGEEKQSVREFFENPVTRTSAVLSGCKNISGVEYLDANRLLAADWGCEIAFGEELPEDIRYVGIRAHAFRPFYEEKKENEDKVTFLIGESRLIEEPFEWNMAFRNRREKGMEGAWIQWLVAKTEWDPSAMPVGFTVDTKKVLLLR